MRDSTYSNTSPQSIAEHPLSTAERKPIIFTDEDLSIFNRDNSVIIFHAQGVGLVFTNAGERLDFTQFKRKHGTLGALWLGHPKRRTFCDYETWRLQRLQRAQEVARA